MPIVHCMLLIVQDSKLLQMTVMCIVHTVKNIYLLKHSSLVLYLTVVPYFSSFFLLCPIVVQEVIILVDIFVTDFLKDSCIYPVSVDTFELY